jgi:hypothetical protein
LWNFLPSASRSLQVKIVSKRACVLAVQLDDSTTGGSPVNRARRSRSPARMHSV